MTLPDPAAWGELQGAVSGLGYCDHSPAPLESAEVVIRGRAGTYTTTTGAGGLYQYWLPQEESPLSIEVTAANHLAGGAAGVMITAGQATVQDFGLRLLQPCLETAPPALEVNLRPGANTTLPFTLTNTGAASAAFVLREMQGGAALRLLSGLAFPAALNAHVAMPPAGEPPYPSLDLPAGGAGPGEKIDPDLLAELEQGGSQEFFVTMRRRADLQAARRLPDKQAKGRYTYSALRWVAETSQQDLLRTLSQRGLAFRSFLITNQVFLKGDLALARELAGRADVAQLSANHRYQLPQEPGRLVNGQARGVEWNVAHIGADRVWGALGVNGSGIVVADADTGVDWTHSALQSHYRGWDGVTASHDYNWHDTTGTYPDAPGDGSGHGTHTTGTMVGDDGAGNQIGVAPGAKWIACKNMADDGSSSDLTLIGCFEWLLAPTDLAGENPDPSQAPDVINNSWGLGGGLQTQFRTAIDHLQAAGILVEVSTGHEGPACGTLRSPGDYASVLTTGAADAMDHLAAFSSRGPSILDPEDAFPDIVAPGVNIRSSLPAGLYAAFDGTSMAGPHTVGLVALMWSANPALRGDIAWTTQIIQRTAAPLVDQAGSSCGGDYVTGPNNDWGYGRIDAYAAVLAARKAGLPWLSVTPAAGMVGGDSAIKVDLAFTALPTLTVGQVYTGLLEVNSSDRYNPFAAIPLSLHVVRYDLALSPGQAQGRAAGRSVTYTLALTNTGLAADTFNLVVESAWPAQAPPAVGPLAPGEGMPFPVVVHIPAGVSGGAGQAAAVTAISQGDPAKTASAVLTTTASKGSFALYLPIASRGEVRRASPDYQRVILPK